MLLQVDGEYLKSALGTFEILDGKILRQYNYTLPKEEQTEENMKKTKKIIYKLQDEEGRIRNIDVESPEFNALVSCDELASGISEVGDIGKGYLQLDDMILEEFGYNTPHKKEKQKSFVLYTLLKNRNCLKRYYKLDINTAVRYLTTLLHTYKSDTYQRPCDAVIGYRCNIGREKTSRALALFARMFPNIIQIKRSCGHYLIKINRHLLLQDPYIRIKYKESKEINRKAIKRLQHKGSVYFYDFCPIVSRRKLRETIIGVTYWYNNLLSGYLETSSYKGLISMYGRRAEDNIRYIEVPIHILSRITGLSGQQILKYLNRCALRCDYLSKHNKGYIDGNLYNENWKSAPLLTPTRLHFDGMKGRPPITPASYILHLDNFIPTKLHQHTVKYKEQYTHLIMRELQYMYEDKQKNDEQYQKFMNSYIGTEDYIRLTPDEICETFTDYNEKFVERLKNDDPVARSLLFEGDEQVAGVTSREELMKAAKNPTARWTNKITHKMFETVDKQTGELKLIPGKIYKLPYYLHSELVFLEDCDKKDFKNVISVVESLTHYIKEYIMYMKENKEERSLLNWRRRLKHYGVLDHFEECFT